MSTPTIDIDSKSDTLSIHFREFDIPAYDLFLKAKALPEFNLEFHRDTETYRITAPARFAEMLGAKAPQHYAGDLSYPAFLFDDQTAILDMALAAKRFACWSDCGLGKTLIQLEFGRQVLHRVPGGRFLIVTLNDIVPQTIEECRRFYGDTLPIFNLTKRDQMRVWMAGGLPDMPRLAITNYEKWNPGGLDDQIVNEARHLAGIALDESSRLKGGGGKQKWALIKSCRGIEYKLSCTATPAPNDTIEFASQASFLEKMRSDGDIIWTFFKRDEKTHRWSVKRHARKAFFTFMAAWSIYVRDPRRYGWRLNHPDVPKPVVTVHEIEPTDAQRTEIRRLCTDKSGQVSMFDTEAVNAIQRMKLSQVAKGFVYLKGEAAGKYRIVESRKPPFVANLIHQEAAAGLQVLCWTVFDAESTILAERLRELGQEYSLLTGKTKEEERISILNRFRHGETPVLISRAAMLGYGMNFQMCGSMVFNGWNDSYEAYYQALRRAYRYGQTKQLRVHLPVVQLLEGDMLENIFAKQERHESAIDEMEENYIEATRRLKGGNK